MKININNSITIFMLILLSSCGLKIMPVATRMTSKTFTPETHSIVWGYMEVWGHEADKQWRTPIKCEPYDLTFRRKRKEDRKKTPPNDGGYTVAGWHAWQYYDAVFFDRDHFYLIVPPGDYEFHQVKGRDGAYVVEHIGPGPGSSRSPIKFSVKNPGTSYYIGAYKTHMKEVSGLNIRDLNPKEKTIEWNRESSVDKISKPSREENLDRILKRAEDTPWKGILSSSLDLP
jgi:hypothetical protein